MRNRVTAVALIAILLLALGSCQLAQESPASSTEDQLIGVYLTPEHLDLFDIERYLRDNWNGTGGEITADGSDAYQQQLYGTLDETDRFVFDVEGFSFFAFELERDYGTCSVVQSDLSDGDYRTSSGDNETSTDISATLYVQPSESICWYVNPVYQCADGRVYLTTGQGISFSGDRGDGMAFSQSFDSERTTTDADGKSVTARTHCKTTVEVKTPPEAIQIVWMSASHQILRTERFDPAAMPESLNSSDAAYLIVEHITADGSVSRALYQPDERTTYIRSYAPGRFGALQAIDTPVTWAEESPAGYSR